MSLLGDDDVLRVRLVRTINGKVHSERLDIAAADVRYFSTPELLRHFAGCLNTARQRLDLAEENLCGFCVADALPASPSGLPSGRRSRSARFV